MKQMFLISIVLLSMFLAVSCKSTPPESTPAETESNDEFNSDFHEVYSRYRSELITDGAEKYIVQRGDTLHAITRVKYGNDNAFFFPLIMLASSDIVQDPDLIEPGMELTIPVLQTNLDDSRARQMIKQFLLDIADVYETKAGSLRAEGVGENDNMYKNDISSRDGLRKLSDSL